MHKSGSCEGFPVVLNTANNPGVCICELFAQFEQTAFFLFVKTTLSRIYDRAKVVTEVAGKDSFSQVGRGGIVKPDNFGNRYNDAVGIVTPFDG